ncbi:hypothetical protein DNTS_011917 [Danionella cerebrum]|uniref:VLIG-type G domain-containing protein n=1 Tax=Danionella cerebrum TaxID=2873325 RepID=A0A553Q7I5_9TELE|nr:hypothetical protein DNTS_011917 [Danionella translucida]
MKNSLASHDALRLHKLTISKRQRSEREPFNGTKMEMNTFQGRKERHEEQLENLFRRLQLHGKYQKLKAAHVLQISNQSCGSCSSDQNAEHDFASTFIHRLLMMNYAARDVTSNMPKKPSYVFHSNNESTDHDIDVFEDIYNVQPSNEEHSNSEDIHPMDVQMAVFHCADSFLKQLLVTKLSECQYALPLLVPNPFTRQLEFPLWAFRQIKKTWKMKGAGGEVHSKTQPVYKVETPMVAFLRFGSVSASKSQLMSSLVNEKQKTFFHRDCTGSSRTRVLMDGVVEIAWYCPSGKDTDKFSECVAFCNLHGDAGDHEEQLNILTETAAVNVILLPQYDKNETDIANITNIYSKPLILLLPESDMKTTKTKIGKCKIGLKGKRQPEILQELVIAIEDICSQSSTMFSLEKLTSFSQSQIVRVDEKEDGNCNRAKRAAEQMMKKLDKEKDSLLPCQGTFWHEWSKTNKELHRPQPNETEMDISAKQAAMKKCREKQQGLKSSEFLQLFLKEMDSFRNAQEKIYFLKWLGILLDERTSENLSALRQKYATQCSEVSKLRNKHDDRKLKTEQKKVKAISKQINSANFGLEHILRELSQIYESCSFVNKNKRDLPVHFSALPSFAAEMMVSGFPLELMDGDAVHIPLIWVSAVIDKLIEKLGDVSVFVLSVLGIQSSGKSTLLNTMFGLQFAVSAGRCTRGAFMQLVKVSEDMKPQLKFDYVLVVDTEGLCAPEISGRETRNHDNELATFVVGIGNLTMINIFGENPVELHKILQIVVQAFLRMKQVKLNPSCMFVHQNVGPEAKEMCIQGRMKLQDELDEMTVLAAKEEGCDIQCFNDVIKFDAQNDVKYFAQLWEGTPPIAPPSPDYSDSAKDLKQTIVSQASAFSGMRLTHFKSRVQGLWEALLNEHFVFSFRDCFEISVYRRLETEYNTWTWKLRYAMLAIENEHLNKIVNRELTEVLENNLKTEIKQTSDEVNKSMSEYFQNDKDAAILIQWKGSFQIKINEVQETIVRETKKKLNDVLHQQQTTKRIEDQKTFYKNTLFEKSKECALQLKGDANNEEVLRGDFDALWNQWLDDIIKETQPTRKINVLQDTRQILGEMYESVPINLMKNTKDITSLPSYEDYVVFRNVSGNRSGITDIRFKDQIRALVTGIVNEMDEKIRSLPIAKMGYNIVYIQEIVQIIKTKIKVHEDEHVEYAFKKKFTVDLILNICERTQKIFIDLHRNFWEANDPRFYLEKEREDYYSVFKKYFHGVKTTAIFGEFMCSKLKEPIQESAYRKTAREMANEMKTNCDAFNGNRSKLEVCILKELAEKEHFSKFMKYIHNPKEHFKDFIRYKVNNYITEHFRTSVLPKINENIDLQKEKIVKAAREASARVTESNGGVALWLKVFTGKLSGVLIFSEETFTGMSYDDVDVKLLNEVFPNELSSVKFDTSKTFRVVNFLDKLDNKDRPDEILIQHFCDCCWVQCPFCKAICTNTLKNHRGDHSVPFHRVIGLNGWYHRGTTNLSISICTSNVATNNSFYPNHLEEKSVLWREYRTAGSQYADWCITPDVGELPYWKWFVCRFQKELENHYSKTFQGSGSIPKEWWENKKNNATESLKHLL